MISAPVSLNTSTAFTANGGSLTVSGVISETVAGNSVSVGGATGTIALTNANTYTGGTFISGATLQVGNNTALGTGALTFTADSTFQSGAANLILANNVGINSGVNASVDTQAQTMTFSGVLSSVDATGTLTKKGSGSLILTGTSTLTAPVTVAQGTLQVGDGVSTTASLGTVGITDNATLAYNLVGPATISNTIGGTGVVAQNGTNTLTLAGTNSFNGLNINNGGTVAFTSTAALGGGNITFNNGTLAIGTTAPGNNIAVPGIGTITGGSGSGTTGIAKVSGAGTLTLIATSGVFDLRGDMTGFTGTVLITDAGGTYRLNGTSGSASATFDLGSNGFVNVRNAGTQTISLGALKGSLGETLQGNANNAVTDTYSIGGANLALDTYGGILADGTFAGAITAVTKVGTGVLDLAGTNSFTGAITVQNGTLTFAGATSIPGTVTAINLGTATTAGVLDLAAATQINTSALTTTGAIAGNTIGSSGIAGTTTTIAFGTAANSVFAGTIVNSLTVNGQTGTNILALAVNSGNLTLSGANTYTGGTTIAGGRLTVGTGGTIGGSNAPLVVNGGTLDLNGNSVTVGSLNGGAAGTIDSVTNTGTSTLTTGGLNAIASFAGVIKNTSGTVGLTKVGTGSLTLTGANTYSGPTNLNGGSLYVNNTSGSGTGTGIVTVNGGILGGSGSISGPVAAGTGAHMINAGATPGAIGTLSIGGGLTTNASTTLAFDLASPTGTSDLIAVTGNVDISAGPTLAISSQASTGTASLGYYKVISYSGTLTGAASNVVLPPIVNNIEYTVDTTQDPGFIDIHRGFIGDATDNGAVDLNDLNTVLNNLGVATSSWRNGNFDGAATIDLNDLNDVLNNLGTSVPSGANIVAFSEALLGQGTPAATPEPTSLGILALGAGALLARRRKA